MTGPSLPSEAVAAAVEYARAHGIVSVTEGSIETIIACAAPAIRAESEASARKLLERIDALQGLLRCYRTERRPSEKLFADLDRTKAAEDEIRNALRGES